jgi:acyl-CoA reductase-like NAD-dependent aldehyde dehydrogenase
MHEYRLLIDGKLVEGARRTEVINPATEDRIAFSPRASQEQAVQAISAAKRAFPDWAARTYAERRALIHTLADAIEKDADNLARLLTMEQGKPLPEAQAEILYTQIFFRMFAEFDFAAETIEDGADRKVEVVRRPLGVVAAIVPWNFPMLLAASKIPQALIVGNTVILKPAPTTPLTALRLGELASGILPPGVLNVLADENDIGPLLSSHPDISKVALTGSTETGRRVMSSAASTIKRITLELGGNDAAIVLPGADIKSTAAGIYAASFSNCGQVCMAIKRVYAHESLYDELCTELAKLAANAVIGNGLTEGVTIGPLQNRAQYNKVLGYLDSAKQGEVLGGGTSHDGPGLFIRPAIVKGLTDGHPLVDKEQFGPILPVVKYSDPEDALRRANNSPFGLGASVWSSDESAAYRVARRLDAGTVWINKHMDFGPTIPFGGAKQSGLGIELAREGVEAFTQLTVINAAKSASA